MEQTNHIKGKWKGFYAYDDPRMHKLVGFGKTYFDLEIAEMIQKKFSGKVQDDVTTGGMTGAGKVKGKLVGDTVRFTKRMPIGAIVLPEGNREKVNRPHPVIFYTGKYFAAEGKMTGKWKIRGRIFFHDRKLYLTRKTTGTWEMQKS